MWSSDFRTHITKKRWDNYICRLEKSEKKWLTQNGNADLTEKNPLQNASADLAESPIKINRIGRMLEVSGDRLFVRFNCFRGMAVDIFVDKAVSQLPVFGTLHHGHFDDIQFGADFYSGHVVFESSGQPKVTDLTKVDPLVYRDAGVLKITALVQTSLGMIEKTWALDDANGSMDLILKFDFNKTLLGALRFGFVTLISDNFDSNALICSANNGGKEKEGFEILGDIDHGRSVSPLVSANQAFGLTDGQMILGDKKLLVCSSFCPTDSALVGMLNVQRIDYKSLIRSYFSAFEIDETSKPRKSFQNTFRLTFKLLASNDAIKSG